VLVAPLVACLLLLWRVIYVSNQTGMDWCASLLAVSRELKGGPLVLDGNGDAARLAQGTKSSSSSIPPTSPSYTQSEYGLDVKKTKSTRRPRGTRISSSTGLPGEMMLQSELGTVEMEAVNHEVIDLDNLTDLD